MWNRKVFIRIIEVLLCVSCVVALRVTDDESRRVFTYLRYRSREWSLLNNVTWGSIGAALASATCGGYFIITTGLLIAAATGELTGRKTETFLLSLGVILFAIVGALSLSSIESVPSDLVDNGAVLGALCIVTALVFITDILISSNQPKKHRNGTNMVTDPKLAKHPMTTTLTTEKETSPEPSRNSPRDDAGKSSRRNSEDRRMEEPSRDRVESRTEDESRHRQHEDIERQTRPYTQNVENGRGYNGDIKRYPMDTDSRNRENRDDIIYYRKPDFYQRPVDEPDTPPFPNDLSGRRSEPIFKKMVNPGIKIMQVDRDVDDNFEGHRYSDSSQYDNVPTRMRNLTHSILKKQRDVSFNVPPPPRSYGVSERTKDDIEMLEECFGILRTTSIATQTRPPSSAFDPGFVRHTASNWPREANVKTPGTSPVLETHH